LFKIIVFKTNEFDVKDRGNRGILVGQRDGIVSGFGSGGETGIAVHPGFGKFTVTGNDATNNVNWSGSRVWMYGNSARLQQ